MPIHQRRIPGQDHCWEQPSCHGCVCDQHHHSCTCWDRVSIKPTTLAGITPCASVYRRLVSVWVTPRAAARGWDRACGQAGAAGADESPG